MRVYFASNINNPKTGKGFFLQRLSVAMSKKGVFVTDNPSESHDISLHPVKIKHNTKSIKVIRLDGVYHNLDINYTSMNQEISKYLKMSDAVIYQSKFAKLLCDTYLTKNDKQYSVIYNGADPGFYNKITPADKKHEHNFIAVARWRPHKRLADIIESFLLSSIDDSCLYIAGDVSQCGLNEKQIQKYKNRSNIIFLGTVDQQILGSYYKMCNASIHLSWIDWCPNSVVEAICAKCVVISNNIGGTPELVSPSGGIVCDIDQPYNLKAVHLYKPPPVDRHIVANAMIQTIDKQKEVEYQHLDIDNIADDYISFFKKL